MECNKDEALRAKEIAGRKLGANDIAGAKKFALKAKSLYPGLSEISQLLAVIVVYVSAENKIDGESDWYLVLDVDPNADDETIRKQYRKMALVLHPDKNKSVGADGAFRLISEAWKLLSDKRKKALFDLRRRAKTFTTVPIPAARPAWAAASSGAYGSNVPTKGPATPSTRGSHRPARGPAARSGARGSNKPTRGSKSKSAGSRKNSAPASRPSTPAPSMNPQPSSSFWTVCHRCKYYHEYLRVYLNCNLLCAICRHPFEAREAPPPHFGSDPLTYWCIHQPENTTYEEANKYASYRTKGRSSPVDGAAAFGNPPFNCTSYQSDPRNNSRSVGQQKRGREEAEAATKREEALRRKL